MTYLARLIALARGEAATIRPRLPTRFEPRQPVAPEPLPQQVRAPAPVAAPAARRETPGAQPRDPTPKLEPRARQPELPRIQTTPPVETRMDRASTDTVSVDRVSTRLSGQVPERVLLPAAPRLAAPPPERKAPEPAPAALAPPARERVLVTPPTRVAALRKDPPVAGTPGRAPPRVVSPHPLVASQAAPEPVITVTIGHVDVRAAPAPSQPARRAKPANSSPSLVEYLQARPR